MSLNGIVAALTLDVGINGDVFKYFIEHVLVPNLWIGACVVMDALNAVTSKDIKGWFTYRCYCT